jgi:tetratricopeptide (TPR) repeat protein
MKTGPLGGEASARSPFKKETFFSSIALIIILCALAYNHSLSGSFIWDDDLLVKKNPQVKTWSHTPQLFVSDIGQGIGKKYSAYRPLQVLSYRADFSLWGLKARGFRTTNLFLHMAVAILVFIFTRLLFKDELLSFLAGVFFALHPVQTEAVAYISGRADLLGALFMLLTFIFYIKYMATKRLTVYFGLLASYVLALLSRESVLVLPLLLCLYHYAFRIKFNKKTFFSILSLCFLYIFIRVYFLRSTFPDVAAVSTTFLNRLPGLFVAFAQYIRLLFWPFDLHMEYGNRLFSFIDPRAWLGGALLLFLLIFAWRMKMKAPLLFFSIAWFLITLLPASNIFPVNAYMAEHWLYLPSLGYFLILSKWITVGSEKKKTKYIAIACLLALLIFYSVLTIRQNEYWKDNIAFFKRTAQYNPNSARLFYDFGLAYDDTGKTEEAIAAYKRAIALDPSRALAYNNMAILYFQKGQRQEAISLFKKSLEIDPKCREARQNLELAEKKMAI